jgi:hypothetical protein
MTKTPTPLEEVKRIQDRSQKLFAGTLTILGLLFGGGLLSLLTGSSEVVGKHVHFLYFAAVFMGVVAGLAGMAAINWESMSARTRALYRIQIAALIVLCACLLGVAAFVVNAGLKQVKEAEQPKVPSAANIEPIDASASDTGPPHDNNAGTKTFTYVPEKAIDTVNHTAWRVPNNGKGEWIEVVFPKPVKVRAVGIIPGHDKIDTSDPDVGDTDRFYQLYVVRQARIEFSDGTAVEEDYERDRSMQWAYPDSPKTTKSVRIEIQATYPPGNNPNGQSYPYTVPETAISEIEIE